MTEVSKDDVICPVSFQYFGWVQNYRVKYNPSKGNFTSRVVKSDKHYNEFVEKMGKTSVQFSAAEGMEAKASFRKHVLAGTMAAPSNWDTKWKGVDEPGIVELKVMYPALYEKGTPVLKNVSKETQTAYDKLVETAKKAEAQAKIFEAEQKKVEEIEMEEAEAEALLFEDEEGGQDDVFDQGAIEALFKAANKEENHAKSFAVTAVPTLENAVEIKVKHQALKPQIHVDTFVFIDPEGNTHEYYLVKNEETGQWNAYEVGMNKFPAAEVTLSEDKKATK